MERNSDHFEQRYPRHNKTSPKHGTQFLLFRVNQMGKQNCIQNSYEIAPDKKLRHFLQTVEYIKECILG